MQKALVKALIIANYCDLSSLVKLDTGRHVLCSCVKKDSWLIKQTKNNESDINIFAVTSSTVDGSSEKKKLENTGLQTFSFTYQFVSGEEHPQCAVCGEVIANTSFKARNLHRH
jgi:hypothetical protein